MTQAPANPVATIEPVIDPGLTTDDLDQIRRKANALMRNPNTPKGVAQAAASFIRVCARLHGRILPLEVNASIDASREPSEPVMFP